MYEFMSDLNTTKLTEPAIKHFYKPEVQTSDRKILPNVEKRAMKSETEDKRDLLF